MAQQLIIVRYFHLKLLTDDQSKYDKNLKYRRKDSTDEYFLTNFVISKWDFIGQVQTCLETKKDVSVTGIGFNSTQLGQLITQESQIVQIKKDCAPAF